MYRWAASGPPNGTSIKRTRPVRPTLAGTWPAPGSFPPPASCPPFTLFGPARSVRAPSPGSRPRPSSPVPCLRGAARSRLRAPGPLSSRLGPASAAPARHFGPILSDLGANSRYILPIGSDAMYLDTHGHDGDEAQKERTMFERFTDQARRVIALAQEESRARNCQRVGTEHLLLGLIQEREGIALAALASLDISPEMVRRQVEEITGQVQGQ